jgi:hypothetical protein
MRKFDKKLQALQWPAHFFCYVTVKLPAEFRALINSIPAIRAEHSVTSIAYFASHTKEKFLFAHSSHD